MTLLGTLLGTSVALTASAGQATAKIPYPIPFTASAKVGPLVDEGTITWKKLATKGTTRTTEFKIETGLSKFSPDRKGGLPVHGRHSHVFYVKPGSARSFTMTPARLAAAGAPAGSAAALFFRVWSIDQSGKSIIKRSDGRLHTLSVKGRPADASYANSIVFGSYNLRSSRAGGSEDFPTQYNWYKDRQDKVVANFVDAAQHGLAPGIVAFQEDLAGPEKTDQGPGSALGQDVSLEDALTGQSVDGINATSVLENLGIDYRLNRSTLYNKNEATVQGVRIMYDANKYTLLSNCDDTMPTSHIQESCTIPVPTVSGNGAHTWASYSEFEIKGTTSRFWVVSAYLNPLQPSSSSLSNTNADLRATQVRAISAAINKLNTANEPVIFAGDFNDWQNDPVSHGWAPHDALIQAGYFDTADAATVTNMQYPTVNAFKPLTADGSGIGSRFDVIGTKNITSGATWFTNRTFQDNGWPSDHDMIEAGFTLP